MIDLSDVTGNGEVRNLSGKDRGLSARLHYKLDALDDSPDPVIVKIPDYLVAISSSFFLGLFSNSVEKLGGRERFLQKYRFEADGWVLDQVNRGIERATAGRGRLRMN